MPNETAVQSKPRGRPRHPRPNRLETADPLLTAHEAAAEVGSSIASWWRGVAAERWPKPLYPSPQSPRWRRSEIFAALEKTRALPSEAVAERVAARNAKHRA